MGKQDNYKDKGQFRKSLESFGDPLKWFDEVTQNLAYEALVTWSIVLTTSGQLFVCIRK